MRGGAEVLFLALGIRRDFFFVNVRRRDFKAVEARRGDGGVSTHVRCEDVVADLEARLADPDLYADAKRAAEVQRAYQQAQSELTRLYEEWEAAEAALQEEP